MFWLNDSILDCISFTILADNFINIKFIFSKEEFSFFFVQVPAKKTANRRWRSVTPS